MGAPVPVASTLIETSPVATAVAIREPPVGAVVAESLADRLTSHALTPARPRTARRAAPVRRG